MAIPHPPVPEGYGNQDTRPRWQVGDFRVGDCVEFYLVSMVTCNHTPLSVALFHLCQVVT